MYACTHTYTHIHRQREIERGAGRQETVLERSKRLRALSPSPPVNVRRHESVSVR